MSAESYAKWWVLTKKQLENLREYDDFIKQSSKPLKSRVRAGQLVCGLYTKYCMIIQDIDACLDQIYQVQKRFTIRKMMDAAVIRLNELKENLKDIDLSEIHYVDGSLIEFKLVPQNIEILNPALIFPRPEEIQDMWERIQKGDKIFIPPTPPSSPPIETVSKVQIVGPDDADPGSGKPQTAESTTSDAKKAESQDINKVDRKKSRSKKKFMLEKKEMSSDELVQFQRRAIITSFITLIQTHERARQERLYFLDITRTPRSENAEEKAPAKKEKEIDPEELNNACIGFQKLYRGHMVRENEKRREIKRRYILGMIEPSWKSTEEQEKVQKTIDIRREIVRQRVREYVDANVKEKERVMRVIAPGLMEDIGDEIREWFYQWYIRAKCFDKIPPEEKGGTVLVVRCETFTPEEYIDDVEKKRREKEKNKGKDMAKEKAEKEKKKKEAEKKKKEAEKKKKEAEKKARAKKNKEFEFKFGDSPAINQLADGFKEYKKLWGERKFADNPEDTLYMDMITDQKCYEMQLEVRQKVDELMRLELELLNDALAFDKAKKSKKGKGGKKKKGKKKGKKGKKGKKDKKDMTKNRKTEDLFQELVDNGIIRTYPVTHLTDFKGDYSYANWDKRQMEYDPLHCTGDVRQTVALTCILPLGVTSMVKPRSVVIAGPRKCGKHVLANAIFTETKCVLFDLSPPVLAGKYPGKPGMKMLIHLVNKMSRLLQPSVIFMDGAEKPFYKKVPKPERELEPKKLGKQLFKGIVKTITPDDRVMVLGITNQPWAGKPAGMKKAYERAILIPRTDYGTAFLCWKDTLMSYHGVDRNIDVSSLAKLSVGYPLCEITDVIKSIMTPRRIIQLAYMPLTQLELYDRLLKSKIGQIPDKEFNKFLKWYKKTPLGKQRAQYQALVDKIREAEEKAAAKAAEKAAQKKK